MKTIQRAILMLRRSKKETISFIMTLTISIGLLYLFVNLQIATKQNEINILEISDTTDLIMLIFTLAIALICAWNSFNANTFFQKAKSKELCVYLSSGMNIVTLSKYLLAQNFIILIISTILGGILGIILNPIINLLIMVLTSTTIPLCNITSYGTITWLAILLFEFIFMVMSNVGYAYRTELKYLLDDSHRLDIGDTRMFKAKDPMYYIFFVLGAILLLILPAKDVFPMVGCAIGIFGLQGILRYAIPKRLELIKNQHTNLNAEKILIVGAFYSLIKTMCFYIIILFALLILMSCFLFAYDMTNYMQIVLCIGYMLLLIMIGISIYYKLIIEAKKQIDEYYHLQLLGFLKKDLQSIVKKEVRLIFFVILAAPLPYAIILALRFLFIQKISFMLCLYVLLSYIVVLLVIGLFTEHSYLKTIFQTDKGEE